MTWTLVQKSAAIAQASGGTVTSSLPAGSTAGNLLVAFLTSQTGGTQFTGPTGWTQGPHVGNGSVSRSEIWYLVDKAGGTTSASFTSGTGNVRSCLAEFHTDVAGAVISLDFSGTGTAGAVATCTATASATAGDLAVCAFTVHYDANQNITWTDPSGFTLARDMINSNTTTYIYGAYNLSATGGSLSVTGTASLASANANGWTGAVATFTAAAAAGQTVRVGASVQTTAFPGKTGPQAAAAFAAATGRPVQVQRVYLQTFPVNAVGTVDLTKGTPDSIQDVINAGRYAVVSFRPAFNPPTQTDFNNLKTTLAAYQAAGLTGEVALWHEPETTTKNLSATQWGALNTFYAAAVTPYFPLVSILGGGSGSVQQYTSYFNSVPAGTFAKAYNDFYCRRWANGGTLDGSAALADAQGIPYGLGEWGCSIANDGQATCLQYFTYIQNFFTPRVAAGTAANLIWFNNSPTGQLVGAITSSADVRVASYQALFDAIASASTGTVTIGASLTVAVTPAGTVTGGAAAPIPVINPGASGPPGFPVLIAEIGAVPTTPVPAPGTFLLSDPTYGLLNLDVLGGSTSWADISGFVKDFTTARTSTRQNAPVISYDPGTLSATLDNSDGRFDPDNLGPSAPYVAAGVTQIHPMTPARIRAVWQGVVYPLFSGFADSWTVPDINYGPRTSETLLAATDGFKVLSGFQLAATAALETAQNDLPQGGGEDTGARVSRLLNIAGWATNDRVIDTGNTPQQPTSLAGPDALTEMQLSVDTELGELYVNGSGQVVFRRRHGVMEDPRSANPQAVFGDQPGQGALLNSNPGFESFPGGSTAGWVTQNNATLQLTGPPSYSGTFAGLFFGDGVTANPGILTSPGAAVTPGQYVTFSAWVYLVGVPWPVTMTIEFFTAGAVHLTASDISTQILGAPGTWQQVSAGGFVPATAATVQGAILMSGTPASPSPECLVDEAYLQLAGELPYTAITRSNDDTELCNDCQVTAAGSANLQEATDTASVARFLYARSYQRTDLLLQSDLEALEWAQFVVYLSKGAEDRFDTLTMNPQRDPRLWPHALGRDIGDMIAVIRRPPGVPAINKQLIIRGITHTVTVSPASWQTQWILQDASRYSFLTLNDPVQGTLNSNALAF